MNFFINDLFWTLQGEGAMAGRRALFVRMPYCNLACSWCDTKFDTYTKWSRPELEAFAKRETGRFAVITGGEPLMHGHTLPLITLLKGLGFYIAVETNGTQKMMNGIDWVTCSPKRDAGFEINPGLVNHVDEYKYVVDKGFDLELLKRHKIQTTAHEPRLSLSPEFTDFAENVATIVEFIKENPEWRLSLQTHKWIGLP